MEEGGKSSTLEDATWHQSGPFRWRLDDLPDAAAVETVHAAYNRLASHWEPFADSVRPPLREPCLDWLETQVAPGTPSLPTSCVFLSAV